MPINRIFARSPFVIEVNEVGQEGSKIELFIYRNGNTPSFFPEYTLQKLIPSSNNVQNLYNISPYLMEQIKHETVSQNYSTDSAVWNIDNYIKVDVKRYKLVLTTYVLLDTTTYWAFDGFGYYSQGFNPLHVGVMPVHLDPKDYYYWADTNNNPTTNQLQRAGTFTAYLRSGRTIRYTQFQTGLTYSYSVTTDDVFNLYRVYPSYYLTGNKVEVLIGSTVIWEANFYPVEECRYDVITLDFINMYGAWQREFMFKASYESLSTNTTEFNLMQQMGLLGAYNTELNQRQGFNTNGTISYRVNTGWVDETFNSNIQQLLLSERILLNNEPVKLKTKEFDKQKNINNKTINYVLEFEQSTDLINNVI
jgi:hypothetical protein